MGDVKSNYGQKDASTPGQDTKKSAEAKSQGMPPWLSPSRDVATSSNTTDTKKLTEDQSGSSGPNWRKLLMTGFVATSLIARTGAQEVPDPSRTRDSNGNELAHRDVEHHSLEPRRVVGSSDSLPYENRGHPDLPSLQVGGVKVPRLTEEDVKAELQQKELPEKISRMTQNPAFDEFLRKLAKTSEVVESLRPLCYMKDQEEVSKLLDNPECKKCIEDLASKPGFQAMVKAVDKEAFQALQEYNANNKEKNGKGPSEKKHILVAPDEKVKAAAIVTTLVVAVGVIAYYRSRPTEIVRHHLSDYGTNWTPAPDDRNKGRFTRRKTREGRFVLEEERDVL